MSLTYEIIIKSYKFAIQTASIFNNKAKLWVKGRKNVFDYLKNKISSEDKIIWIHAASLGEFEQGRPIIEEIKRQYNEYKILLTFFSPSGYEIRKNYELADFVCYLPVDTKKNAQKFIEIVNPVKVFFVKYEFWKNYLTTLHNKNIDVFLVSGIFRKDQIFFKFYGKSYRKVLKNFNHLFLQNNESAELLKSIGIVNYTVCGDTRFDRVIDIAQKSANYPEIEKFAVNSKLIVAGSSWEKDEEILAKYINQTDDVKIIIAPHEIKKSNIERIKKLFTKKILLYSEIKDEKNPENYDVLIIDNIGMLSSIYKYGQIAYIGGGFGAGIHNILEAAVYGMPVFFGPKYHKFDEAKELIKRGGAFSINDFSEFKQKTNELFNNSEKLKLASQISKGFVKVNAGAVKKIMEYCFK